jgi:S-adenosylmethionine/arginine decarboxylase-like enzyme
MEKTMNTARALGQSHLRAVKSEPSHFPSRTPNLADVEREFQEGAWGLLTSLDLSHCDPVVIRSAEALRVFAIELCAILKMKRYGEGQVVHFGQDEKVSGYSLTQLIETSLISGHFVDFTNKAYIDIFSCAAYDPAGAAMFTKEFFRASDVHTSTLFRY